MASKSLGTLTLDLVAKTAGFTGPMDKAARNTKKNSEQMAKYGKAVGAAVGAGAVAAVAGISLMIARERDLIDEQAKVAQKLDTTYESMANLRRAGELGGVGFNTIETAGRTLNANIGKAIQGVTLQADAFERLGLSAQEVYDVPLDQRIAMINKALNENVSASERAAVAGDLFGTRNAAAIQQLDPGTIAEAARQVEIFGLNLSDVDAAKVEMANDAMSTFGLITDGIGKQLTVELAPILKAIGEEFLNSAEEAGGLGNQVESAVEKSVKALAFVVDAGDGVGRVFSVVADTIVGTFATGEYWVKRLSASVLEALDAIPGIDLTVDAADMRRSVEQARMVAQEAAKEISNAISEPLAGERLRNAYAAAQEAGEAAAEATIKSRELAHSTGDAYQEVDDAAKKATDEIAKQISALEKAAKVWGMTADEVSLYELRTSGATEQQLSYAASLLETVSGFEAAKDAQDAYAKLVEDLRTDEEKLTDQLSARLEVMQQVADLSDEERNNAYSRIAADVFPDMPEFEGLDASVGGAFGELAKIDKAEEALEEWYETQLDMLEKFREEKSELSQQWDEEELQLKQQHEDQLAEIEQARHTAQLVAAQGIFGDMADATAAYAGEQSAAYKALFAASKAFAIADGLVQVADGVAKAANNPWPINLAAMASVAAAGAGVIANIQSVSLSGMAHDGIDSVPNDGTWLLQKGERVTTAETSAKLDGVLEDIRGSRAAGGGMGGDNYFSFPNVTDAREARKAEAGMQRAVGRAMARAQRYT